MKGGRESHARVFGQKRVMPVKRAAARSERAEKSRLVAESHRYCCQRGTKRVDPRLPVVRETAVSRCSRARPAAVYAYAIRIMQRLHWLCVWLPSAHCLRRVDERRVTVRIGLKR